MIAATLAIYAQVINHDFIHFDDPFYLTDNPTVASGLTASGIVWAFTTGHTGNWHPITWVSHMLDVQIFGMDPGAHHAVNALLHLFNALLLYGFLRKTTGAEGASLMVAAIFALHPLRAESVAWLSERKDVLSGFFWMLTLWAYAAYARKPGAVRYLGVAGCFVLGLMAKPMGVTLPFVLLLLDVWPLGRWPLADRSLYARRVAGLIAEKLPLLVVSAVSSLVTFAVQQSGGAMTDYATVSFLFRVGNAAIAYVAYMAKMVFPAGLSVVYPYPDTLPGWQVAGALAVLSAATFLACRTRRTRPYLFVGWFWFVGTLVPVIGLIQVGVQRMACRYTYLPLIGLSIAVVWGIEQAVSKKNGRYRRHLACVGAAVAGVMACLSFQEVRIWQNTVPLFERALAVTRGNFVAHTALGDALIDRGQIRAAIDHYRAALTIHPDFDVARLKLATLQLRLGQAAAASANFDRITGGYPDRAAVQFNLGNGFFSQGAMNRAMVHYRRALAADPGFAAAHNNLGMVLAISNRMAEAVDHFQRAIQIQGDFPDAQMNLKRVQSQMDRSGRGGPGNGPDTGQPAVHVAQ